MSSDLSLRGLLKVPQCLQAAVHLKVGITDSVRCCGIASNTIRAFSRREVWERPTRRFGGADWHMSPFLLPILRQTAANRHGLSRRRPLARAAGTLAAGTPAAGTLAAGTPAAGTPAAGTPAAGPLAAGTPAAGTLAAGIPAAGTLAAGTLAAGIPAAGTLAAGI